MGEAGLMVALVDAAGTILAANGAFSVRAAGPEGEGGAVQGSAVRRPARRLAGRPVPLRRRGQGGAAAAHRPGPGRRRPAGASRSSCCSTTFPGPRGEDENAHVHALLDSLPLGLALADTDGRFIFLNKVFRRAVGLGPSERPAWPGDLVVDEDKAAVSDAVHRFGRGRPMSGDLAVRLKTNPEEPVALTVAGARGLGNAAVLLSLKDNSEEARLKREIAQATKMQAVGQLAGGVAHDFNNILTAILGTCDLMMMRHTPGDSDYDDIQQIRSNSNRAANLTRQLLAFSRQQTLRPQVLQLPDVVAEVSHLLDRLLGERIKLEVKHGRGLGAVRADPGQLEQVIVNLAVNARDAMIAKDPTGGGTLTLQTFGVSADDVRRMGSDVLPIGDYTALKVTDTGIGIPQHLLEQDLRALLHHQGGGEGDRPRPLHRLRHRQAVGRLHLRRIAGPQGHQLHHLSPGPPRPARRGAGQGQGEGEGRRALGHRHHPASSRTRSMVRAVAERALARHGYTVLVAENGEAALEILAPRGQGRPDDLRRGHADHGRPDHGPRRAQDAPRSADPVHLRLCRGAAAQVDRHPQRLLPRQALLGPAARRDGRDVLAPK